MKIADIPIGQLYYLASPYTKYAKGMEIAYADIARIAAALLKAGYFFYSPITHCHPIAMLGGIEPRDHQIWLPFNRAIMDRCDALIVAMMDGWEASYGVRWEINQFRDAGKPIHYLQSKDGG